MSQRVPPTWRLLSKQFWLSRILTRSDILTGIKMSPTLALSFFFAKGFACNIAGKDEH